VTAVFEFECVGASVVVGCLSDPKLYSSIPAMLDMRPIRFLFLQHALWVFFSFAAEKL